MEILERSKGKNIWLALVAASIFLASFGLISHNAFADTVVATISDGPEPWGVGVNPTTNMIYVSNMGSTTTPVRSLAIINGSTNSVVASIQGTSPPVGVGVNPVTNKIYVAQLQGSSISVIDGLTKSVVVNIPDSGGPGGIGVNPNTNRIYVANFAGTVSVIDGSTNNVVANIPVGTWTREVGVNPVTNKIYATNEYSNNVYVIDGSTNAVVGVIQNLSGAYGIGVNANTNKIYVSYNGGIAVIDGSTNNVIATMNVAGTYGVGINPNTNKIYAASGNNDNYVSVINGSTNSVIQTISVGNAPNEVGINSATNMIYVTNILSSTISVIDGSKPDPSATSPPAGVIVKSVDQSNNPIYGILTLLCSQGTSTNANGSNTCETGQSRLSSGYTTATFGAAQGQTFGVDVYNNATCSFSHWSDNAQNTYRFRLFTATSPPAILTAVYTCGIPQPPTNLAATAGNAHVSLSWTAPSSSGSSAITSYNIYRGTTSGGEAKLTSVPATQTSYTDSQVNNGQQYFYKVTAVNSVGESTQSNEASVTPTAPIPPSPTTITISVNSDDLCGTTITGMSTVIRYSNGTTIQESFTPASFTVNTGPTYVIHVRNYGSDVFDHWMNGNTTSYYTLTPTQNVTLTAYYSTGSTCTSPTATAPGSPTGLTATAVSSSQVNLSWTAPASNGGSAITGYKIERSTDSGTTWSTIANTASTSTTYSDTGLAASTAYTYRVSATNAVGTSTPSNTVSATTSSPTTPPPTPTQVTITVNSVNLSGSPITGLWTILRYTNGTTITQGYTPATFTVASGTTYVVHVGNYGSDVFNHWMNGNTTSYYTLTPTQNVTLTAYYSTG